MTSLSAKLSRTKYAGGIGWCKLPSSMDTAITPKTYSSTDLPAEVILNIMTYLFYSGAEGAATVLQTSRALYKEFERHFDHELDWTNLAAFNKVNKSEGRSLKVPRIAIDLTLGNKLALEDQSRIFKAWSSRLSDINIKCPQVQMVNWFTLTHLHPVRLKPSFAASVESLICIENAVLPDSISPDTTSYSTVKTKGSSGVGSFHGLGSHTIFSSCKEAWFEFQHEGRNDQIHLKDPSSFPVLEFAFIVVPREFNTLMDSVYKRFFQANGFPDHVKIAFIVLTKEEKPSEYEVRMMNFTTFIVNRLRTESLCFRRAATIYVPEFDKERCDLAAVKESIKATLKSQWDELDARAREM